MSLLVFICMGHPGSPVAGEIGFRSDFGRIQVEEQEHNRIKMRIF